MRSRAVQFVVLLLILISIAVPGIFGWNFFVKTLYVFNLFIIVFAVAL